MGGCVPSHVSLTVYADSSLAYIQSVFMIQSNYANKMWSRNLSKLCRQTDASLAVGDQHMMKISETQQSERWQIGDMFATMHSDLKGSTQHCHNFIIFLFKLSQCCVQSTIYVKVVDM